MEPLEDCNSSLVVLIEVNGGEFQGDRTWFYDIVNTVNIRMTNEPHAHPIPYGTSVTDHVNRNPDEITITGVIGCVKCNTENNNFRNVVRALKRLKERMMYSKDEYVTLTSNHWMARYMILTGVDVAENQNSVMIKQITTTWRATSLVGTTRNPDFKLGGIVH